MRALKDQGEPDHRDDVDRSGGPRKNPQAHPQRPIIDS